MPGARKGMPGARAPSAKKQTREKNSHAARAPDPKGNSAHGSQRATLEGRAALLAKLLKRKESAETRIRLAEIYISLEQLSRARTNLEACLAADPADPLCARRVLVPVLLQLGERAAALALLAKWGESDKSAVMLCSALLCVLAADELDETAADAAFQAALAQNWHAVALLAAVAGGESPIPEATIEKLREQRLESLKSATAWPAAGGAEEALL
eukprot:6775032-Prymnesium_polylepis.1